MTPNLTTDRLQLRPVRRADVPAIFAIARIRESIEDFQHQSETEEDVIKWLTPTLDDETVHTWVLIRENEVVGVVEVEPEPEFSEAAPGVGRVGYFIDVAHQGLGLATEALSAAVDWALSEGGFTRLEAGVTANNPASRRILEKTGFTYVKTEVDDWEWRGVIHDTLHFATE